MKKLLDIFLLILLGVGSVALMKFSDSFALFSIDYILAVALITAFTVIAYLCNNCLKKFYIAQSVFSALIVIINIVDGFPTIKVELKKK